MTITMPNGIMHGGHTRGYHEQKNKQQPSFSDDHDHDNRRHQNDVCPACADSGLTATRRQIPWEALLAPTSADARHRVVLITHDPASIVRFIRRQQPTPELQL